MDYVLNVDLVKKQLGEKIFKKVSDAFKNVKEFKCHIRVQPSNGLEYQLTDDTKEAFLKDIDFSLLVFQSVYHKQFDLLKNIDSYWHVTKLLDWKEVLHIAFGLVDEEGVKEAWANIARGRSKPGYLQERLTNLFLEATCPKQIHILGELMNWDLFDRTKIRNAIFQKSERHFLWMYDTKARKVFERLIRPYNIPILESYLEHYHTDKIQVILELILNGVPKDVIQYGIMPYL